MNIHPRAKLGPAARRELCQAIAAGASMRSAARAFSVAPATAHKWWHRFCSGEGLRDRSSRPHHSPRTLPAAQQERICEVRRHTGRGPRLMAGITGHPHSTVHRTLARHGISRPPRPARERVVRYEWPCPGDLLHVDTKRYGRFERPGHRVTGFATRPAPRSRPAGAGSLPIRSSTITLAWPTQSCTQTSGRRPWPAFCVAHLPSLKPRGSSPGG
jgi:transposase-like protein